MMLKTSLSVIAVILSISVYAQDKIYKKNGDIIEAKVIAVGDKAVNYKRFNNTDGPDYTIYIRDISKIVYQNGSTDNFEEGKPSKNGRQKAGKGYSKDTRQKTKFGDNIISFIPLLYTAELVNSSINDPGIGVCYERLLDNNGHIGLNIPVMLNFTANRDFNYSYYNFGGNYNTNPYTGGGSYFSLWFAPGVKFYPASSKHRCRYSLGASFFSVFGSEPYSVYDNGQSGTNGTWNYNMYGIMITNSLNVSITKHFYMAIDLSGAIPFSDNRYQGQNISDEILIPWQQIAVKTGYRF